MKRNLLLSLLLIGALIGGAPALADNDNEQVELAVVNFSSLLGNVMADEDIEGITHEKVDLVAQDLGYDIVVNTATLELYLEGILDRVTDFAQNDVTEEVEEIVGDKDSLEAITELPLVHKITDQVFNEL